MGVLLIFSDTSELTVCPCAIYDSALIPDRYPNYQLQFYLHTTPHEYGCSSPHRRIYQSQRPQIKTVSGLLPILNSDCNFGLNTYPYRTGMSDERSGKHNDNKAYQLN
jgi:hypothetical protein